MLNPNALFQKALSLHRSGNLSEAAAIYRLLLKDYPDAPQLLTYSGIVALQLGEIEDSIQLFDKSLAVAPDQPMVLSNRGLGLHRANRLDEALASYDSALALQPGYVEVHFKRGNVLMDLGRFEDAIRSYDQVLVLKPDHIEAHLNRGIVLYKLHRLDEALASYECVLALNPDHVEGHNNRGTVLQSLKRFDEALASYDQALALNPDHVEVLINRGETLQALGLLEESLANYDRVLALDPGDVEAHISLGNTLRDLNRLDEALLSFNRAVALQPEDARAQWNKSLLKIQLGDYEDGWRLYEWGWKNGKRGTPRAFSQRLWLGEDDIAGQTLLIYPEQGLGDFIQFCRYVPMAAALGAGVILETPATLAALVSTLQGDFTVIEEGRRLPVFDLHCPLMSLPLAFRTTLDTLPAGSPYLHADDGRRARWRELLGQKTGPRIGVVWSGNPRHNKDHERSIPFVLMQPLFNLTMEFHALQNDIRAGDLESVSRCRNLRLHREGLTDFAETAALVQEMDVVIAVDTAVAHLAGALGKDVWILLPFSPDYRWMLDRLDSPWYPTAKLFRQRAVGEWEGVVADVAARLKRL